MSFTRSTTDSAWLEGVLTPMAAEADEDGRVHYRLQLGGQTLPLDDWLGARLSLRATGDIQCLNCGSATAESFGRGYCRRCFFTLARCDFCMVSPERCHYFEGTCREPGWGERFCFTPHLVYLANASSPKVGITRAGNLPGRWLNQGASQGLAILQVTSRRQAGFVEALFREQISDRTSWQRMLKGPPAPVDLVALRDRLFERLAPGLDDLRRRFGTDTIAVCPQARVSTFEYPALAWPERVRARNLDREATIEGRLMALKGQYLLLDSGVINLRKYAGYRVRLRLDGEASAAPGQQALL